MISNRVAAILKVIYPAYGIIIVFFCMDVCPATWMSSMMEQPCMDMKRSHSSTDAEGARVELPTPSIGRLEEVEKVSLWEHCRVADLIVLWVVNLVNNPMAIFCRLYHTPHLFNGRKYQLHF